MATAEQELIGSFTVLNQNNEKQQVLVSQDKVAHYSGKVSHFKKLTLDSLDGAAVLKTGDPDLFQLQDGTTLRKIEPTSLYR